MSAERREAVRYEIGEDAVARVTLDVPGDPHNALRGEHLSEANRVLDRLEESRRDLAGVILRSAKPDTFSAGADIAMLEAFADAAEATRLSQAAQRLGVRLAALPVPTVATIHGTCLGGGLELALACQGRVCSDAPGTRLGLPEVQIGVLPGAGGTQRLPRVINLPAALELMLSGRRVDAREARRLGLVDECVAAELLEPAALRRIEALRGRRGRRARRLGLWLLYGNPLARRVICRRARASAQRRAGGHYPAIDAIVDCVEAGLGGGERRGLMAEARRFGELAVGPVARELRYLYFASTGLKTARWVDAEPRPVRRLGILGAGLMGGGIAAVTVDPAATPVRLRDPAGEALERAIRHVDGQVARRRRRGRLSRYQAAAALQRLTATPDLTGLGAADLLIEAVPESLETKRAVLAEAEAATRPATVFASNTSALPIARIAEGAARPGRVVGMHYFSPVERMPLLEVIAHAGSDPDAVATAVDLGRRQGKTVVVVADGPGFFVNRLLGPYLAEAGRLLEAGVGVERIDGALRRFGFPMGPFELLDEVGIDVAAKVAPVLQEAYGERMAPPALIDELVAAGHTGRKAGRGFYHHPEEGRRTVDAGIYRRLGVEPGREMAEAAVVDRLALPLVNEAVRCLEDGVIGRPRDGDVAAVFGIGFPPFRGGPFRYLEARGAGDIAATLAALAAEHGERLGPAPGLTARAGGTATAEAQAGAGGPRRGG